MKKPVRAAVKLFRSHPGDCMKFILVETVLRLMALCPLLFLLSPALRMGAVLCPVLMVLLVLPARRSAAETMHRFIDGEGVLSAPSLLPLEGYRAKLAHGLSRAALMLLWLSPFIAAVSYAVWAYYNVDMFTLLRFIIDLGGGDVKPGAVRLLLIGVATLIPFVFGMALHCGDRHAFALKGKPARGKMILAWVKSLFTVIPFAAALCMIGAGYVLELVEAVNNLMGGLHIPSPGIRALWAVIAFALLQLPLVPLKSLIVACAAHPEEKA